jgi:hypothetical protein
MSNDNGESDVTPTESEATRTVGNSSHGSGEIPGSIHVIGRGSVGEGEMPQCQHARFKVGQKGSRSEQV